MNKPANTNKSYGYWPNVGYVVFLEEIRTETGTVKWKDVLHVCGSIEEARALADETH